MVVSLFASGCGAWEGTLTEKHSLPNDAEYQSPSQWRIDPPTGDSTRTDWERDRTKGGHTTIVLDRDNDLVSIRLAACDTNTCNQIKAAAPRVVSALESSGGIRFTIEDVRFIRQEVHLDINTAAFDWSENRVLPTAEELDAAYSEGDK